ncbi:UDP-N-acetylmuramate--L-alanine ligase [Nocardioides limicola]|uniref:UDP-N-acetylmuramate--L-alanine ligase n=1 Tax=Nocardioides limicola TaxID=2803368 RepID=UPI00193B8C9C|nr:UDP-N-acetylmuramate--L-alanine ligase [Nocardioides sp. DJM-14]
MRVDVPARVLPAEELGRVHFIGIGGAGLSAIARIMLERGIEVSGSDANDSPTLQALRDLGARVHVGHAAEHLGDADTVVVSTAVREDNPEVVAAQAAGLRVWPRSAALASVMAGRRTLAVAGTHGKTTTTSLLTVALLAAGADPTFAVGGELHQLGTNARHGSGADFVAEADESDGAFLVYSPYAAVVTNVEADHLDNWGTEEAYRAAFEEFLDRIDASGFVVCCIDDPGAAALADVARGRGLRVVAVGEHPDADYRLSDVRFAGRDSAAEVCHGPDLLGTLRLQIPGRHYLVDAVAALALGLELGHDFEALTAGMAGFAGTKRRMEFKGEAAGVRVFDSYAHHPNEITGDLEAARAVAGDGQLVVAFQPHLVSRTRIFGAQMGRALGAADQVVVLDVYLAREDADPEVTGGTVAAAVPLPDERVSFVADRARVVGELIARSNPGDLVLTLGAGDVTEVGPLLLAALSDGRDG